MRKLLSAREIAALKLPDLPTTKLAIATRAEREGWYSEERTGLGGKRRVYELPRRYLGEGMGTAAPPKESKPSGVVEGRAQVDVEMLRVATQALEEWLQEKGLGLPPDRKAAVVAVLYDYLAKGANRDEMLLMIRAMAA